MGYSLLDDGKYNVTFWGGYTWNPSRLDGKKPVDEHDIFSVLTYSANTDAGAISGCSMAELLSGEPIMGSGPFVMNTPEEIRQAMADYQSGKMGRLS